MQFSNSIVSIVWYTTVIFFFFSIFSLIVFFILKWLASHRINVVSRNIKFYQSEQFFLDNLPKDNKKLISYIYELGRRMILTNDAQEKDKIRKYIESKNIIEIVDKKYDSSYLKLKKIYYLSLLAVLNHPSEKKRFRALIYNKQNTLEYTTLSLYGFAVQSSTSKELYELYQMLHWVYENKYVDRRYCQFFFVLTVKNMTYSELFDFFYLIVKETIHIPTMIALIYALSQLPRHENLQNVFLSIQRHTNNNAEVTAAIIRLLRVWDVKADQFILANYNDDNDIVRIAISKHALAMTHKSKHYKLLCYLYDPNLNVRNNFYASILEHNITREDIQDMLTILYKERSKSKFMSSCLELK